jgi:hypothetical protein
VRVIFCGNPKYILRKVQIDTQLYARVGENNVECTVKPKAIRFSGIRIAQDGAKQKPNSDKAHDQELYRV